MFMSYCIFIQVVGIHVAPATNQGIVCIFQNMSMRHYLHGSYLLKILESAHVSLSIFTDHYRS